MRSSSVLEASLKDAAPPDSAAGQPGSVEAEILLVDGRPLVRQCLAGALEAAWPAARVAATGWDQLDRGFHGREADVCLASLDGSASGPDEASLARLRAAFPGAALVVLSDDDRYPAVAKAAGLGARGYFSTSADLRVLVQGIRLVLVGGTAMPVAVAAAAPAVPPLAREPNPAAMSRFSAELFTPKEIEVLRSLASGRPNKLIAHELSICETTVKVHLRHIFRKLGTSNRTHAALLAREMLDDAAVAG
jgi:DNA-binding NarL/FixJ family response regulator